MPVSPQDFELYSRMTGAPMPTDAMSRMQMAPEVFIILRKDFAKKPNILEKTGNLVKNIGRGAVMALGAPLVAASEAENARIQEQLRNKADVKQSEAVTMENPTEKVAPAPELTAVEKAELAKQDTARVKTDEQIRLEEARAKLRNIANENIETYSIPANQTTADSYGQDYVPNQTATNVVDRKMEQGSQIADSTPNIAEVLSESQDSQPSEEMIGGADKEFIAKFRKKNNLDKALKGVFKLGQQEEELVDDSTIVRSGSPLNDHPDVKDVSGGEEPNPRMGTNTSPTEDISGFHKDMRKMEALERIAEKSPSTKQIALGEMNKSREGFMAQDGPNKPAYDAKQRIGQRAKDEMLAQMKKNKEDEERIKKLNLNQDRPTTTTPEQKENFKRMIAAHELQKVFPESQDRSLLDPLGLLNDPKFMSAVRQGQNKARLESNLISDRVDDFTAKFVEGAKSDIVRGARGKKSLGITRIPATNGDAQVGFVLADKAVPEMPKNVPLDSPLRDETGALRNPYGGAKYSTTYGFGVAPGAESLLDNQLNKDSFSDYMQRGMMESKKGIKRKAGEIFEFLPPSARVVSGTARLGDIVM